MPITCIPEFIVTGYAVLVYRQLKNELRIFSWFIFLSCAVELISMPFWWFHKNNLPMLHVYVAVGFFCLARFYKTALRDFINPKIIHVILIVFLSFTLLNSIFIQKIFTFNSYALTVESVLIIIFSFSTLLISQNEIVRNNATILSKSINWINSGLFIYFSSNLLLFYFGNIINKSFPIYLSQYTWLLHNFFSSIMYACFFIALWKRPKM
jgi:hypothetical protein